MALRADDVDLGRDRDLVLCAQSGDADAFEDLYRRYFARLYRFCLRRVGDPHEAEELTQEAFARAYGALPRLAGERRFYPWLSVIASRLCVDAFRRRARSEPAPVIDLGVFEAGPDHMDDAADVDLLGEALARLTPRHRHVLRLREQEGWSYQHIADHYDVSLGTVEALLHRARKALRREFDSLAHGDARRAAGLPALGWLARRLDRLRSRLAGWEAAWAPMVGNAVVATVVVVGSAVSSPSGPAGASVRMTPAAAVSEAPAPVAAEETAEASGAPERVGRSAPARAGAAPGGSVRDSFLDQDIRVTRTSTGHQDEQMRQRADDGPSGAESDDAWLGTDPRNVGREAAETVDHYVDMFQEDE